MLFITGLVSAQTIPVGSLLQVEDAYRRQQLLGIDTSNTSFMLRPLFMSEAHNLNLYEEGNGTDLQSWNKTLLQNKSGKAGLYLLPVVWQQQINSHHPYGWNDGAMIPAKGYQSLVSAGFFAKIGPLSVQLRPEFVHAVNKDYTKQSQIDNGPDFVNAYKIFMSSIDQPERFRNSAYTKLGFGQSSIRLTFDPVSFGFSNENLWWGPGVRGSLLMSNNAPGFKHFTLNTTRPVKTPIGSFEAQLIGGKLESSGTEPSLSLNIPAKRGNWRYLSGIVVSYQPKWVPGLYLGVDRTYMIYHNDLGNGLLDYFPVFSAVTKSRYFNKETNIDEEDQPRDQRISLFVRWLMPESHSEVYFQFAKNDHNYNLRDEFVEIEHQRAYLAGFRKLVPLNTQNEFIQVGIELMQLEAPGNKTIRGSGNFYGHTQVKQGYTNIGQVIGAGIGSGSNLQSLDLSWVRGLKKVGLQIERIVQNNDLFYAAFTPTKNYRRHWVDLGFTGKFDWDYKGFVLSSQLAYIRSLNYQYRFKEAEGFFWDWAKQDTNNIQLQVGVMYRW